MRLPLDTPITYEPWMMDRGSLLFASAAVLNREVLPASLPDELKICGEGDSITFADGSSDTVLPVV